MDKIILAAILYLLIGITLIVWDFGKSFIRKNQAGTYLEQPLFLDNLTISTAFIFVFVWPYKLLKKIAR